MSTEMSHDVLKKLHRIKTSYKIKKFKKKSNFRHAICLTLFEVNCRRLGGVNRLKGISSVYSELGLFYYTPPWLVRCYGNPLLW